MRIFLVLLFVFSNIVFANPSELSRMDESMFYARIEKETDRLLKVVEPKLLEEEARGLKKVKQVVLKTIKDQNPIHHVLDIVKKHGVGAGVTAAVTEVVTILILPPIFTTMGMPTLAAATMASPSFAATVPMYIGWSIQRQKKKIGKELGIENIKELDKLRHQLLGYAVDSRIMSVMLSNADEQLEVSVIKRKFARFRKAPKGHVAELSELEDIVKKNLGKNTLNILKDSAHGDDVLYTNLLVNLINRDETSQNEFFELIKNRVDSDGIDIKPANHTVLLEVDEKLKYVKKEINRIDDLGSHFSKDQRKLLKQLKEKLKSEYFTLEFNLRKFEFTYLQKIHEGHDIGENRFKSLAGNLLKDFEDLDQKLTKFEGFFDDLKGADRGDILRRIERINIGNDFPLKKSSGCAAIFNRILRI